MVSAQGRQRLRRTRPALRAMTETLPGLGGEGVGELRERLGELDRRISEYAHRLAQLAQQKAAATRVMPVEGVGPITAPAVVATLGEGHACQQGRQCAAWLGLGPRQHSPGGKTGLGRITNPGNGY